MNHNEGIFEPRRGNYEPLGEKLPTMPRGIKSHNEGLCLAVWGEGFGT